ncbi:HIT-like protein [Amylocystis lapponica]|nr:HIT-like protein [Amylocystis lapponica]
MTSFIIKAHEGRAIAEEWQSWKDDCPFCRIIRGEASAFRVFENDKVIAVLDILPLRPGHTLVIPKTHCARVSELPLEFAAATGEAITRVSHAMTEALQNTRLNVVCNQEYAQAVPHVHYHIIPAPSLEAPEDLSENVDHVSVPLREKDIGFRERELRDELNDEAGNAIAEKIRARM